ncbi:DAK2 domain-containing protein [Mycoplasma procyoni]|uniref:DAK2 domain-containing protein n=1 Tax=Mycoplasma procyoni TaxID=568784 RepID=UPI00197C498B|nr:DAK2 domain-containing protein [Mycoplasma procyoni]MBN3534357.1 DAK2 domain-containing protein [Mycoplasma procyoni]
MNMLNGDLYLKMLVSGVNNLTNGKEKINALNVFPVPDGDTGSNMAITASSGVKGLEQKTNTNLGEISQTISRNMLLGARGNSGVILSQIFRGFADSFASKSEVNGFQLVEAFRAATTKAYSSVLKPIEGTILTVIRETTETLEKTITPKTSIEGIFELAIKAAKKSSNNTQNLLPVLKQVGVNDSGGEGFILVLEGMHKYLIGSPVEISDEAVNISEFVSDTEIYDGEFGYCTEFIIELKNPKKFVKDDLVAQVSKYANSLVVVQDGDWVKVHGHALKPGNLLNAAQKYGEFIKIKSENMTLQANESKNIADDSKNNAKKVKSGIVSCNTGQGIINVMKENGAHFIIEGGQSNNPSINDIIQAIKSVNAECVFVLPNNSNIMLSAQQAVQTITDKKVVIIPTKTQLQGISAIFNFNEESSWKENKELMEDAIRSVDSGEVTTASRTTELDGVKIKEGQFLSIANGKVVASVESFIDAAKKVVDKMIKKDSELVTIYFGTDATKVDAKEVANYIETNYDVEVEINNGEQKLYHFLIAIE